ncbi:MAG: hypothetical protein ACYDAG_02755 [Chloroflexota bacterium]
MHTYPPGEIDFMSDEQKGHPPRKVQVGDTRLYRGVSMWSSPTPAAETAQRWDLGEDLAGLDIPADSGVIISKTRGPAHYTVEGDPKQLLSFVREHLAVKSVLEGRNDV